MRLIDADALNKSVLEWLPSDPCGRPEAEHPFETDICISMLQEIEKSPTIDAVPVVRCKDCIHYESDGGAMMICNVTDTVCDNDDYCSCGERRKDVKE